jgi:DNA-binding transcriptional LysR family regulator
MNMPQLKTFVLVVEHGSFSAAARAEGISQPAVTMQIKSLESDVGATLLDRGYRRAELTEAGQVLLPFARRILREVEDVRVQIDALSHTIGGRLLLVASTTPGDYVVPGLLGAFLADNPRVQVEIAVSDSAQAIEAVESGRADLGIVGARDAGAKVTFEELSLDDIVTICPNGHPLALRSRVPLADLAEQVWVAREPGSGTWRVARRLLAEHGVDVDELRVAVELGTGEAVLRAVEGGVGIAMVSGYVAAKALELGTVSRVDIAETLPGRPFFAVIPNRKLTRAASAFLDHLRRALVDSGDPVASVGG